ncbi:hypothetical protein J3F83DRAFT_752064, partial [Trichoderma novae-zelandiae]
MAKLRISFIFFFYQFHRVTCQTCDCLHYKPHYAFAHTKPSQSAESQDGGRTDSMNLWRGTAGPSMYVPRSIPTEVTLGSQPLRVVPVIRCCATQAVAMLPPCIPLHNTTPSASSASSRSTRSSALPKGRRDARLSWYPNGAEVF